MKNFIKHLNKKLIVSLALAAAIGVGTTAAFSSDITETVKNMFFLKEKVVTELEEETDTQLSKAPYVHNKGKADALVRMRISISSPIEDRQSIFEKYFGLSGIDDTYTGVFDEFINVDTKGQNTSDFWQKKNQENRYDGYYYYKKVLKSGENTEPLFDKILKKERNEYKPFTFDCSSNKCTLSESDLATAKHLNDVKITLYQESIPTKVTLKDGTELKVEIAKDGTISEEQQEIVEKIWEYFDLGDIVTE